MPEEKKEYRQLGMDAVCLLGCALHGMPPRAGWAERAGLLEFCRFHSVAAMAAMALEPAGLADSRWKQEKDRAIRKNILLNAERQRITGYLDSIGCWYLPLKGSVLQYDYPKFGMRQMTDNDILIDPAFQQEAHDFMVASGYEATLYRQTSDDQYCKPPVYNFELHTSLFMDSRDPVSAGYYRDVRSRLLPEGQGCGLRFASEDFYIYMTVHAYKHFTASGVGLRHLVDVYVFLRKYGDAIDLTYVDRELEKLGAGEFERACRQLSRLLWDSPGQTPEPDRQQWLWLDAFFCAGTFGTGALRMQKTLQRLQPDGKPVRFTTKLRYVWTRLFPPVKELEITFPWLKTKRWLMPLAILWRLLRAVLRKGGDILAELKRLNRENTEN